MLVVTLLDQIAPGRDLAFSAEVAALYAPAVARELGKDRTQIRRWMKRFGLARDDG